MPLENPPAPDPELVTLANAIGEDPIPEIEGAGAPPSPAPEKGKEKPPKGEPETSEEKAERERAEEAEREEAEEKGKGKPPEDEDPLRGLELKQLLEHPALGPMLQRWSDTAGNTRIAVAVEKERESLAASAKRTAEEEREDERWASMSKEEVAEEISGDSKAAVAYSQYQARLQAGTGAGLNPEAVAKASEVYAVAAQVLLNTQMLEGSELSQEVKDTLKPENFNQPGGAGLTAWGEEIFKALVTHEAEEIAERLKEEGWEAYKQEHMAEIDGERPPAVGGRRAAGVPDLIETPTPTLFEDAFAEKKPDKEGAK